MSVVPVGAVLVLAVLVPVAFVHAVPVVVVLGPVLAVAALVAVTLLALLMHRQMILRCGVVGSDSSL